MSDWWEIQRQKKISRRAEPPGKEKSIKAPWYVSSIAWCCCGSFSSSSLWQPTGRGGGGLLPGDICNKTGRPVAEVFRDKYPDMHVPPAENPMFGAFKDYKYVPKMVPLDFTEA